MWLVNQMHVKEDRISFRKHNQSEILRFVSPFTSCACMLPHPATSSRHKTCRKKTVDEGSRIFKKQNQKIYPGEFGPGQSGACRHQGCFHEVKRSSPYKSLGSMWTAAIQIILCNADQALLRAGMLRSNSHVSSRFLFTGSAEWNCFA